MPDERYEPGTELYAVRDCQGWRWGDFDEPTTVPVAARRGECLGVIFKYYDDVKFVTTERDGALYDWDARDVTAGAEQQELGL